MLIVHDFSVMGRDVSMVSSHVAVKCLFHLSRCADWGVFMSTVTGD